MKIHQIIIVIGNIVLFLTGIYIGRTSPHISILKIGDKNSLISQTAEENNLLDISNAPSFTEIGVKYKTDKVLLHHYDKMYEKYVKKYRGSNVTLLEIGLGCTMGYGPGASAYMWREYFGPQATIHFIEFNQKCGEQWYQNHGIKVNLVIKYPTKYFFQL